MELAAESSRGRLSTRRRRVRGRGRERARPSGLARCGRGPAAAVVLAGIVTSCGSSGSASTKGGLIDVVASTSVWGSVASAVGGQTVDVSSVISSPDQDPHSFEASARTLLQVKEAELVIVNGGGYDDFMASMISSSGTSAPVLDAVTISGHRATADHPLNEHVWYDVQSVKKVALEVASQLSRLAPAHRADFTANADAFNRKLDGIAATERQIRAADGGTGVGITEAVPLSMLEAMGLRNRTPLSFSAAVEEGTEVSARALAETLDLYSQHKVAALVYNEQTTGPVPEQVLAAAVAAGIPVVAVTETLPTATTYLRWMTHNVTMVRQALAR